ncbi:hypothetical protein BN7_3859 [Wickerhamomyces ciferrii]|uniref:Uncharacterized protein n=1 Tax=Wickerhamomyces ciferrii (strain ATCC 14091 / BCRC 22168 / CBS 111 / JCM 3599 / NBRC 0793 / NRRL Y-1031 F-60-10) TaxID=1206466 RepID=K0KQ65_WICCF|nr:uncharacterized protein BN7_3859 [Wickerhamomyces ciferrii]CCH44297.1 hypothetical protein BN7_3859 [Wickerhamomyces ciferrii]
MISITDLPNHALQKIFIKHLKYGFEELKGLYKMDKMFGDLLIENIAIVTNDRNLPQHAMTMVDGLQDLDLKVFDEMNVNYSIWIVNYNTELDNGGVSNVYKHLLEDTFFKVNFFTQLNLFQSNYLDGQITTENKHIQYEDEAENQLVLANQSLSLELEDAFFLGYSEFYVGSPNNDFVEELQLRSVSDPITHESYISENRFSKEDFEKYVIKLVIFTNQQTKDHNIDGLKLKNLKSLYLATSDFDFNYTAHDYLDTLNNQDVSTEGSALKETVDFKGLDGLLSDTGEDPFYFQQPLLYSINNCDFERLEEVKMTIDVHVDAISNTNMSSLKKLVIKNNFFLKLNDVKLDSLEYLKIAQTVDYSLPLDLDVMDELNHFCEKHSIRFRDINRINYYDFQNLNFSSLKHIVVPDINSLKGFDKTELLRLNSIEVSHDPSYPQNVMIFLNHPDTPLSKEKQDYQMEFMDEDIRGDIDDFFHKFNGIITISAEDNSDDEDVVILENDVTNIHTIYAPLRNYSNYMQISSEYNLAEYREDHYEESFIDDLDVVECKTSKGSSDTLYRMFRYCAFV